MPDRTSVSQLARPLHVEMAQERDGAWVRFHGELDLSSAADAEAAIVSATALMQRVTIDLRGLDFIDSSGVALLVRAERRARRRGATLTVVAGAGPVTRLLQLCGLDRELAIVHDPGHEV